MSDEAIRTIQLLRLELAEARSREKVGAEAYQKKEKQHQLLLDAANAVIDQKPNAMTTLIAAVEFTKG